MKLTNSSGKTLDILWMDGPISPSNVLVISLADDRPLSEIAADFEGQESYTAVNDSGWTRSVEGFTVLTGITRRGPNNHAMLTLKQPEV